MSKLSDAAAQVFWDLGSATVGGYLLAAMLADEKDQSLGPHSAQVLTSLRETIRKKHPNFDGRLTAEG